MKRREAQARLSQHQAPNFLIKNQVDCIVEGTRKQGRCPYATLQKIALSVCAYVTASERADPVRLSMSMTSHKDGGIPSPSGMRSSKMQKKQPTLLEKQLEAARRDDFEALLQGYNPRGMGSCCSYVTAAIKHSCLLRGQARCL